jgi:hypothetical protein
LLDINHIIAKNFLNDTVNNHLNLTNLNADQSTDLKELLNLTSLSNSVTKDNSDVE